MAYIIIMVLTLSDTFGDEGVFLMLWPFSVHFANAQYAAHFILFCLIFPPSIPYVLSLFNLYQFTTESYLTPPLPLWFVLCRVPVVTSSSPLLPFFFFILLSRSFLWSVPPTILQLDEPKRNQDWCIPFSVTGNPEPKLQWYHQGQPLQERDYIKTMIHESTENEYLGCLQLDIPTHIHNGIYTLVATNEYGDDQKNITAHFMHIPDLEPSGTYNNTE